MLAPHDPARIALDLVLDLRFSTLYDLAHVVDRGSPAPVKPLSVAFGTPARSASAVAAEAFKVGVFNIIISPDQSVAAPPIHRTVGL